MRLSVTKGDPGYCGVPPLGVRITLDGVELKHCVTADEEQGLAIVARRENDRFVLEPGGGRVAVDELRGTVVITLPETVRGRR